MMPDNNSSAFCDHFPMGIRCSSVCAKLRIPLDCSRVGLSLALINAEYVGFDCFVVISVLVQILSASTHQQQHRIFMLGIVMLQSSQGLSVLALGLQVHFFRPVPKEYLHSAELRDIMQFGSSNTAVFFKMRVAGVLHIFQFETKQVLSSTSQSSEKHGIYCLDFTAI